MGNVEKIAYFERTSSLLFGDKWREHLDLQGCVPLDTPMVVSMNRPAPGEPAPPPAKPAVKQKKEPKAEQEQAREATLQKKFVRQIQERQARAESNNAPPPKAEPAEKLPPFDLLDIPGAMDKMGWPVSAKLAREWFSRPKHVYDNNMDSVQPSTTPRSRWNGVWDSRARGRNVSS